MSLFTKIRNTVTGVAGPVIGAVAGATGLSGLLGGSPQMPSMGQPQGSEAQSGEMGYQQSLANLMQMVGQQPQVSQTGTTSNADGGLI